MIKIGLVGGAKIWHGMTFAMLFNGFDEKKVKKLKWGPHYTSRVARDARITHIWDPKRKDAEEVADVCSIENVVRRKEDMIGPIDGVLIADDCTMRHQRRAEPFITARIPTFIDKPLSPDIAEATRIVRLARKCGTPIMSSSSIRYARELEALRRDMKKLGRIMTGNAICANELMFYGIHALEPLLALVGTDVESVRNVGKKGNDVVALRFRDGRIFTVTVLKGIRGLFQVTLYGEKGWGRMTALDYDYLYCNQMRHFVKMVRTGKEPIEPEETLKIIRILVTAVKSRKGNRELRI